MTGGAISLEGAKFEQPFALVFGNESGDCLRSTESNRYERNDTPQRSDNSLSLPVAVSIGLYEASKSAYDTDRTAV